METPTGRQSLVSLWRKAAATTARLQVRGHGSSAAWSAAGQGLQLFAAALQLQEWDLGRRHGSESSPPRAAPQSQEPRRPKEGRLPTGEDGRPPGSGRDSLLCHVPRPVVACCPQGGGPSATVITGKGRRTRRAAVPCHGIESGILPRLVLLPLYVYSRPLVCSARCTDLMRGYCGRQRASSMALG